MKVSNTGGTSNGSLPYDGTLDKLYKICQKISTTEARAWLFNHLIGKKLTTRDIYFFALKQAQLRTENKDLDPLTIKFAMKAKQRDLKKTLDCLWRNKRSLEATLLLELNGRRYKFKKMLKKIKECARGVREKKIACGGTRDL